MKILKKAIVVFVMLPLLLSCNSEKKESKVSETKIAADLISNNKGLLLLQQKCYACHSITSKSHDEIIAPPMAAVVRRYKMSYSSKDVFVNAFTNYVLDPTTDSALMFGAVKQFNVMPKQPFDKTEINQIAEYVFNNEVETPVWFEDHFSSEHPNGMGNGNGMGKGNGNGKGMGRGQGKYKN